MMIRAAPLARATAAVVNVRKTPIMTTMPVASRTALAKDPMVIAFGGKADCLDTSLCRRGSAGDAAAEDVDVAEALDAVGQEDAAIELGKMIAISSHRRCSLAISGWLTDRVVIPNIVLRYRHVPSPWSCPIILVVSRKLKAVGASGLADWPCSWACRGRGR